MTADLGPVSGSATPVGAAGRRDRRLELVRALRPRQWVKNVLVFVAPGAAGVLTRPASLVRVVVALAAFCLLASGAYLVNDITDADTDRRHPTKRHRPIAAGTVPTALAVPAAVVLMAAGLGLGALVGWRLLVVLVAYVAITLAYSAGLKRVAVLDLGCVAAGFVLRAIAGGAAARVPLSQWFLIVAGAGSLFMVAGKRQADAVLPGVEGAGTRRASAVYTMAYLRFVSGVAAAVAIAAYSLWAFDRASLDINPVAAQLSVVPFVLGLLRYAHCVELGQGGAPEDVVLGDRALQLIGLAWLVVFASGVQLGR